MLGSGAEPVAAQQLGDQSVLTVHVRGTVGLEQERQLIFQRNLLCTCPIVLAQDVTEPGGQQVLTIASHHDIQMVVGQVGTRGTAFATLESAIPLVTPPVPVERIRCRRHLFHRVDDDQQIDDRLRRQSRN